MNSIAVSLVLLVAPLSVASLLALALAIHRAGDGYQDETGFHRGSAPVYVRPSVPRRPRFPAPTPVRTNRPPMAELTSVN